METNNIILEQLRIIRDDVNEMKQVQRLFEKHLALIQYHMAGYQAMHAKFGQEIEELWGCIDRIDRRLEMHDEELKGRWKHLISLKGKAQVLMGETGRRNKVQ